MLSNIVVFIFSLTDYLQTCPKQNCLITATGGMPDERKLGQHPAITGKLYSIYVFTIFFICLSH